MKYSINDTIAAVATSAGESGIGILRISGPGALLVADRVMRLKSGKRPSAARTYTLHYGWVVQGEELIDEAILTVMRAPRSYTREDVAEISVHSGLIPLRRCLELVLANGARLAEPGEFTRRAFLNGRIDLAQAEAVLDIIHSKTDAALKNSVEQLKGALSARIGRVYGQLLAALAELEAGIDFPDDAGATDCRALSLSLERALGSLEEMLEESKYGRVLREGMRAVICGKPNVGKSSLLNALLKEERCIVTPIAGTTRDTIEEVIDIKGIPLRIADTAGLIEPRDMIERKAISRSTQYIRNADVVILVFDGSRPLSGEDLAVIKKVGRKRAIAVVNKTDLRQRLCREELRKKFPVLVEISAKRSHNLKELEEALVSGLGEKGPGLGEAGLVANARHIARVRDAQKSVAAAKRSLDNKVFPELIAQDIRDALRSLDEILGRSSSEELLDKIFSEFCIGK